MSSFYTAIWNLFVTFINDIPWMAIALMALFAFKRHKESKMLLLQAGGAAGMVVLSLGQWLVAQLMTVLKLSYEIYNAEVVIYRFLAFVALSLFALGYCLERFKRRTDVPGFPVQQ